jgi:hypothetical protein
MTQLDDKIREALEETGIESPDFGDDDTLRSMISDAYAGKLRWMFVLWTLWQLVFFIGFVYAGVELFSMVSSEDPLFWAAIFVMTGVAMSMIKLMHWILMNRNRVLREIKRLELETARLGKKLGAR